MHDAKVQQLKVFIEKMKRNSKKLYLSLEIYIQGKGTNLKEIKKQFA